MMNYVIVSGYMGQETFFDIWYKNTRKYANPQKICCVSTTEPPQTPYDVDWVSVKNLGHVHDMPNDRQIGGWAAGFLMGCMLAYHHEADLIYKESDCLAFGPWVEKLYREIGSYGAIIGKKNSGPGIDSFYGQSLVLVNYHYLLEFMTQYMSINASDKQILPEYKFEQIMRNGKVTTMSFGYDRTKPFNINDEVFYTQQLTAKELETLKEKQLI